MDGNFNDKKINYLIQIRKKSSKSDILNIISKFQEPPLSIRFIFKILSFSFSKENWINRIEDEGERLSNSLESMGTTFIKLGQFLATRPDIMEKNYRKN